MPQKRFSVPQLLRLLPSLLLVLLGLGVMAGGLRYGVGTLTSMGPGFMPLLCGLLLLLLALGSLASEFLATAPETPGLSVAVLRPLGCVTGSILLWALLAERFGFVAACMAQTVLAYLALPQRNWLKLLLLSALSILLAWLLFVRLLGIPLPAFRG